jgi:hypothetical protein
MLESKVADLNNVASGGFAGSIVCALFLRRFVSKAAAWLHIDIYGWTSRAKPGRPEGGMPGRARAIRAPVRALRMNFLSFRGAAQRRARNPYSRRELWIPDSRASLGFRNDRANSTRN